MSEKMGAVIIATVHGMRNEIYKPLEEIEGLTAAERVAVNLRRAGVKDIVIVTDEASDKLKKKLKGFGVTFLTTNQPETERKTEMLDAVKTGLGYLRLRCDKVFVCPVDVPFFSELTVRKLMESGAEIAIPSYQMRGGHPVLIGKNAADHILKYTGDGGLKMAIRSMEVRPVYVEVEDEGIFVHADEAEAPELVKQRNEEMVCAMSKVRLFNKKPYFGPGLVTLLRQIDSLGSVREASEKTGISYSKAWQMIKIAEEESGKCLVDRQQGGKSGGMARMTEEGKAMTDKYEELEREVQRFTDEAYRRIFSE